MQLANYFCFKPNINFSSRDKNREYTKLIERNITLEQEKLNQIGKLRETISDLEAAKERLKAEFQAKAVEQEKLLQDENSRKIDEYMIKDVFPWAYKRISESLKTSFESQQSKLVEVADALEAEYEARAEERTNKKLAFYVEMEKDYANSKKQLSDERKQVDDLKMRVADLEQEIKAEEEAKKDQAMEELAKKCKDMEKEFHTQKGGGRGVRRRWSWTRRGYPSFAMHFSSKILTFQV